MVPRKTADRTKVPAESPRFGEFGKADLRGGSAVLHRRNVETRTRCEEFREETLDNVETPTALASSLQNSLEFWHCKLDRRRLSRGEHLFRYGFRGERRILALKRIVGNSAELGNIETAERPGAENRGRIDLRNGIQ